MIGSRSNPKKWENPEISTGGRQAGGRESRLQDLHVNREKSWKSCKRLTSQPERQSVNIRAMLNASIAIQFTTSSVSKLTPMKAS
jgi:hypothetical protein